MQKNTVSNSLIYPTPATAQLASLPGTPAVRAKSPGRLGFLGKHFAIGGWNIFLRVPFPVENEPYCGLAIRIRSGRAPGGACGSYWSHFPRIRAVFGNSRLQTKPTAAAARLLLVIRSADVSEKIIGAAERNVKASAALLGGVSAVCDIITDGDESSGLLDKCECREVCGLRSPVASGVGTQRSPGDRAGRPLTTGKNGSARATKL
ncbi:hypothetical protein EVAR_59041_1 [Eumeta japonica]|uniref:Uncharacterized protein n=1 Tax=Eumeta variegata TaxID=151549 RepID=A0A4C1Z934_EUMVA|nr:hypothetical protein EVAR_59041_1 [Eumeta japonica]